MAEHGKIREDLRVVWSDVLGCEVDMHEDIFDMDVGSIQILELASALQRAGWPVALPTLVELGTVAKLADHLEQMDQAQARP